MKNDRTREAAVANLPCVPGAISGAQDAARSNHWFAPRSFFKPQLRACAPLGQAPAVVISSGNCDLSSTETFS
jgi:hypothetical protein